MNVRKNKLVALAALGLTGGLALSACGGGDTGNGGDGGNAGGNGGSNGSDAGGQEGGAGYAELTGSIAGSGASSMQNAQTAWTESFMGLVQAEGGDVTVTYDATGSGTGREQFLNSEVKFAGTDSPLDEEELAASTEVCNGEQAFNLPVYISPIAVVYNLEGVDELNLTPEVIGGIFAGDITKWNDEKIVEHNPDANLPDKDIVPVHRSDDSGTTENFTEYLSENAPDAWTHGPVETWPIDGGQSGDGTSGLISTVEGGDGTIGYADASQAGNLGIAKIQVGEEFVEYSAEAAAKAVDVSPRAEGREENDIVVELDRTTTEQGVYPIVLISYLALCGSYADAGEGEAVKAYASYIISEDGQQVGADNAGSAPLSDELSSEAQAAIDGIQVG
ncbi:phosphate ABC transporter substrate-binding protein PstS [Brachybacterium sp. p3-SID1565]|uniref:Phosphate-binding protein n=1 Tax=Brachybacterium epidermidis TaxID=2781983 RepID=A0ABR9VZE9_9MICO|nr:MULTISPECIES: phosphate ABC transporter substrate-binding protein PstS [unclassified Brachybacterium]MBE9403566.1 phosphate ABC transporter substrate-binding protein PstS [Brachybacterium epidermidis]MCT1386389.1 phosphate ABC transporter substrate-binding protein PstS [Brachybacterium sp. p3-SID1565]MCT1776597.1 phosphate ABC transporter substrate-binding protein PstS [Brachybacterium sp. p3-SID957]